MTDPQLPRIVGILAAVGLALALNEYAPGTLQAVLLLIVLYAVLTNVPRVQELIGTVPATLRRGYSGPAATPVSTGSTRPGTATLVA